MPATETSCASRRTSSPVRPTVRWRMCFCSDDGSVVCRGCRDTPAVSELGHFLDALLPAGSPRVPGAVRYTIARALLDVDAPPFESLDDFSRDLARHEQGDRAEDVRRALARRPTGDRRSRAERTPIAGRAAALRARRCGVNCAKPTSVSTSSSTSSRRRRSRSSTSPRPRRRNRRRTLSAAAVCLAAGLSLIGAGELMHRRHVASRRAHRAGRLPQARAPDAAAPPWNRRWQRRSERGIIAVRDVHRGRCATACPKLRRTSLKRPSRVAAPVVRRQDRSRPPSRKRPRSPAPRLAAKGVQRALRSLSRLAKRDCAYNLSAMATLHPFRALRPDAANAPASRPFPTTSSAPRRPARWPTATR